MQQVIDVLRHLGQVLRKKTDDITREPPPVRWVDLIHHLYEQERKQKEADAARRQTGPPVKRSSRDG